VFLQRRTADRIEVMLADRARHEVREGGDLHVLVLYDGERYEAEPGRPEMRRVRFAEHGIPVRVGASVAGPARVETRPTLDLMLDGAPAAQAEFQRRVSLPLMALILAVLAVPLAELRPRQGRYARIGIVILVYFIYANLLSAAQTWVEKGWIQPALGVWWTHALVLLAALWLWWRQSPPGWAVR
jgi:lipopolysaccharide export system permease protein